MARVFQSRWSRRISTEWDDVAGKSLLRTREPVWIYGLGGKAMSPVAKETTAVRGLKTDTMDATTMKKTATKGAVDESLGLVRRTSHPDTRTPGTPLRIFAFSRRTCVSQLFLFPRGKRDVYPFERAAQRSTIAPEGSHNARHTCTFAVARFSNPKPFR